MATLTVGPNEEFSTLSAAVAASQNGDLIQVQAGTYTNDFSIITTQITIEGVGGTVDLVATEPPPDEKGILTTNANVTIENVSFSGAAISSAEGGNGAGIRYQDGTLTLINDDFHNNQNGILGNPNPTGSVIIENSTFEDNGSGTGYTHDIYIGDIASFTLLNSTVASAQVGHEVKTRAENNTIIGNVIEDGSTGTSSYEIDMPDGGNDLVENNVIEKGPNAQNQAMVHFGGEGIPYANSALTLSGNTFINNYGPSAVAVLNQTILPVVITGNTFDAIAASHIVSGAATETNNWLNGTLVAGGTSGIGGTGNSEIFTDSNPHTVTLTQSGFAVEGGGGLLTVTSTAGHVTVIGGSGGLVFTDVNAGGDYIATAAGATDTVTLSGQDAVDSAGTDVINLGHGNADIQATGNATINGGPGSNAYTLSGNDSLVGGYGSDTVGVMSTGQVTISGSEDYLALSNLGGNVQFNITQNYTTQMSATVQGGSINLTVYNAKLSATTAGGGSGVVLRLGAGNDNITSGGPDTIYGGSGMDSVIVSTTAQIYAGSGGLSVYGNGDTGGATVYGGAGNYFIGGAGGNIDFIGGSTTGSVQAGLSNITIQGGAGRLNISGSGGRETIIGGQGGINFTTSAGADIISTAAGATDNIALAGATTVNSAGNDSISGGAGNQTITVSGISVITGSTGNSSYTLDGNDLLTSQTLGSDTVTVGAAGNALISTATAGLITVNDAGGTVMFSDTAGGNQETATVRGGSVTLSEPSAKAAQITTGTQGGSSIVLGTGSDVLTSKGADTISVGAANLSMTGTGASSVTGGSGSFSYTGGSGTMNFIGGSGTASINGGSGTLNITAGSGNVTLKGGNASSNFVAGSGAATVTDGSLASSVQFGVGNTTVTDGTAADLYRAVFGSGGGTNVIQHFKVGQDQLILQGFATNPVASEAVVGGSLVIGLTDKTQITLTGVTSLPANAIQVIG